MSNTHLQQLKDSFNQLASAEQEMVLAFAEFLRQRTKAKIEPVPEPQLIPRPVEESVVAAIKRLAKSYPMLEKQKMLDETATLMTQHILQGRDAVEVIDELEKIFSFHYQALKTQKG